MVSNQTYIPDGWESKELGSLYFERRKSKLKVSDATNYGGTPFYTSGDTILEHNEILISGENIFLATGGVANVKYYDGNVAYSTDTYAIYGKEDIDTKFLFFKILDQLYYVNANYFQGSGLKHLQKKDFKKHQFSFPKNKAEQQTIASILSKCDAAIAHTQALIAKYTRIKTGLMQDLLTKGIDENGNIRSEDTHEFKDSPLGRIPKEWECEKLGDLINEGFGIIQTGPFGSQLHANEYVIEGVPVIMPQDIITDKISMSKIVKIKPEKAIQLKRHFTNENDILFARRGDLSKCSVISDKIIGAICGTGCLLIRLNKAKINSFWLLMIYQHHSCQKEIDITSVGSTMQNLNTKILSNLPIPQISFLEQNQIVEKIFASNVLISKTEIELTKLQSLKTGLMQDLLSGRVRVKVSEPLINAD